MTVAATASVLLLIRRDPRTSALPVEALRIALGLAAGEHPITVVLVGPAVQLLANNREEILDLDILEDYLASCGHLHIPFLLVQGQEPRPALQEGFSVTEGTLESTGQAMRAADRVLVF